MFIGDDNDADGNYRHYHHFSYDATNHVSTTSCQAKFTLSKAANYSLRGEESRFSRVNVQPNSLRGRIPVPAVSLRNFTTENRGNKENHDSLADSEDM